MLPFLNVTVGMMEEEVSPFDAYIDQMNVTSIDYPYRTITGVK